jgi:TRAP transporter TAXI family solute receptor
MGTGTPRGAVGVLAAAACVLSVGACARGPDEAALRDEVQQKLDRQFQPGLLELAKLKRQGSAPQPPADDGAERLVVYYNATVRLNQDYQFGSWEGLSPATLAQVLGATEKGLSGIDPERNRKGDPVYVYGSSTYVRRGDAWASVGSTGSPGAPPASPGDAAPPTRSQQLVRQLASMVDLPPPGLEPAQEQVISDELDRAVQTIGRRLERQKRAVVIAGGPPGGEYSRITEGVVRGVARALPQREVAALETVGSVENAWLLDRGEADFALMQSDIAALAASGEGAFARGGPITTLRALASLFPEPVHVVVPARSAIRAVADLRGKRVGLGWRDSGTHHTAVAVLKAHGLGLEDLAATTEQDTADSVKGLRSGTLDAFFVTIAAPTRAIQDLATRDGMRLVSLDEKAVDRLVAERVGLVGLTVPAHTYPRQTEDVRTVAATALLVATADTPDAAVELLLKILFEGADFAATGSSQGVRVSPRNALRGITLPMHPGAGVYLKQRAAAGPTG